tara:strand:- start:352 stop:894 length:543 start_codon:yes stop_codon:yes gene_type:complete
MNQLPYFQTVLLLFIITNTGCNDNKTETGLTSTDTTEINLISSNKTSLNLIDYPKEFLQANELDEWEGFENLHESMERLKELNFDGVEVDLIALSSRVKSLRSGPLPQKLEVPQIISRLKVVEMQVQKARYFTQHYKKDSLIPALNLLYDYYNGFVSRMVSLQNEDQDFETGLETTTLDQ